MKLMNDNDKCPRCGNDWEASSCEHCALVYVEPSQTGTCVCNEISRMIEEQ